MVKTKNGTGTVEKLDAQIAILERQIHPLTLEASKLRITDEKSAGKAADFLRRVKDGLKAADSSRRELTDPLNAVIRNINARFKKVTSAAAQAEKTGKTKLGEYYRQQEEIARKEQAKLEAQQAKQHERDVKKADKKGWEKPLPPPPPTVAAPEKTIAGKTGTVQIQKRWTFEQTDFAAVPDKYKVLSDKLVRDELHNAIRTTQAPPEIAGIRFFQKEVVSV